MKNSILKLGAKYMAIGGLLAMCSCSSELEKDLPQAKPISRQFAANTLTITAGMDLAGINGILSQAQSGDVIEVEGGVYAITGKLELKDGITLKKQAGATSAPIFDAMSSSTSQMLEQDWKTGNNVTIEGVTFHNIRFKIENADGISFNDCIFDHGVRKAGTDKKETNDAYIQIVGSKNMKVESCVFKRRINNSGRGIFVKQSNHTKIIKNTFGDTDATAHFVTAINDNSNGTLIEGNTIKRNASWVKKEETDHGIYAHSFDGLMIKNNTISGWPANGEGGAVKARNGKNLTITDNTMNDSGIILNVYDNLSTKYLKNVIIQNNTITLKSGAMADNIYSGIGYWKNTSDTSFYEESIKIEGNTLTNGFLNISSSHLNITKFNENGGGIYNNKAAKFSIPQGINASGNITN
ncbi:right-handed parallel beta-helix repeat-containing protein [Tenacibaculum maritimum]|uniref:right-handed parallel beta-helix repeat-containing protein n=1 Tax=Tenacibaculum maritimum TaxID=107401 RepID=UPI001E6282FD|nr:right-handed parallel beta-helix repeat-containing protein [Tenacibaculum maritimum]MCD9610289.1 right-handed parallel beta-helix repeat-containing protein [Tenacibaculum maritimum]